jgi:hypothetical protein
LADEDAETSSDASPAPTAQESSAEPAPGGGE